MLRIRSYRTLLLAAVALTLCFRGNAQTNAPRSSITVHVHKAGLFSGFAHDHVIAAPIASGTLDAKAMTIQITVAAKQMKVADPDVSDKDRAEIQSTMLGPKVLDPDKYPEIRFQSSNVQKAGDHYRVTGKLELHGASRELSFDVSGGPDHYQGKTKLKQTDFGMEPISLGGGTIKVKDELEIEIDVYSADLTRSNRP
ncbi:MAG TPA: YceI family protein [Candidatus Angelobacter sp.]